MEVKSCRSCGRLFNYLGGPYICTECAKKLETKFQEVREFVRDHPDAPIATVAEEMDVSVKQIKQWIREERLEFSEDSQMGLACENCGKLIRTGRFCDECKSKMASEMEKVNPKRSMPTPQKRQRDGNKMRFLDK